MEKIHVRKFLIWLLLCSIFRDIESIRSRQFFTYWELISFFW